MAKDDQSPLFRPEAVAEQQDRWLGSVLLVPRVRHTLYTSIAAGLVAGVIALAGFGEYTRKVRLQGWLAPEQGLVEIVAPQGGTLLLLAAREGLEVEKDATLAVVSTERRSETVGATQGEVLRTLRSRRDSLVGERERHVELFARQAASQAARLAAIDAELASLDGQLALQREQVARADADAARQRGLLGRGLVVETALRDAEETALQRAMALAEMARARAAAERGRVELEAEIAELPLRKDLQIAEIDRAVAGLEQELAEAEAAREIVVAAPQAGTVTALRAASGAGVGANEPLMTLVPAGARLEALLYGPSRDVGFIQPGQRVLIRFDTFPYQKFGQYEGVVRTVSHATVGPEELAEAAGRITGLSVAGEPAYRISVELREQTASAYGEAIALRPGMTLAADVLIEKRRIWQWVLDPLHALRGERQA